MQKQEGLQRTKRCRDINCVANKYEWKLLAICGWPIAWLSCAIARQFGRNGERSDLTIFTHVWPLPRPWPMHHRSPSLQIPIYHWMFAEGFEQIHWIYLLFPSPPPLSLLLERLMEAAAAAEQSLPHRCH